MSLTPTAVSYTYNTDSAGGFCTYNRGMFIERLPPLPFEPRPGRPRLHSIREDAFDDHTSVEAAYWAGFLYADGCITPKPRWVVTLTLSERDRDHVDDFARFIGYDVAQVRHGVTPAHHKVIASAHARLTVGSRRLCGALYQWGLVPRKTWAPASPPPMSGDVLTAFLRGIFDGNGCLHVNRKGNLQAAFCGNPDVVDWFVAQSGHPHGGLRLRNTTAYAQWSGHARAVALAARLYSGPGPALARKLVIAKVFI